MKAEQKHIIEKIKQLYSSEFLNESEVKELEEWIQDADTNAELEFYFKNNWQQARALARQPHQAMEISMPAFASKKHKVMKLYQQIAAVLLLPVIGALLFLTVKDQVKERQMMTVRTEMGDRAHFYLPDGTEVYMNALSSLEYSMDYGLSNRCVEITGEVFFDVFKNKSLPFQVMADSLTIEALGTQFLVRNYLDETYVQSSLVEGKVKVGSTTEEMVLLPGEGIDYSKLDAKLTKTSIDSDMVLAWTQGLLIFKNDNMEQVCRKIEHWYGVSVMYDPYDFEGKTFSLRLRKEETLFNLLAVMGEVMQLNYRMVEDKVIINKQ